MVNFEFTSFIKFLELMFILIKQFKVSNVPILIKMIQFLCFWNNSDSSTNLIVKDYLWYGFSIFDSKLFEDRIRLIINFISQRLFLILASSTKRAISYQNDFKFLTNLIKILLKIIRMTFDLIDCRRILNKWEKIQKSLNSKITHSDRFYQSFIF